MDGSSTFQICTKLVTILDWAYSLFRTSSTNGQTSDCCHCCASQMTKVSEQSPQQRCLLLEYSYDARASREFSYYSLQMPSHSHSTRKIKECKEQLGVLMKHYIKCLTSSTVQDVRKMLDYNKTPSYCCVQGKLAVIYV